MSQREKKKNVIKAFLKNELCSIFYLYLISCGCFFTVVWNEASLNRVKAHTTGLWEITGRSLLPTDPCLHCHHQLDFEFIHHETPEGKGRIFFSFIFIQHLVLTKINPITLCWLNTMNLLQIAWIIQISFIPPVFQTFLHQPQ